MSWTLDHVGPICKTVEDAALFLGAIAGYDPMDPVSVDISTADYAAATRMPASKLRVGVPRTPFFDNLNAEVASAVNTALDVIRKIAESVQDVQIPATGNVADVWNPEIYAYHMPWITKSPELYQEATRTLIQRGDGGKSSAYAEARHQVDVVRRDIKKVFTKVDVLITPTQRGTAPLIIQPQPAANAATGTGRGAVPGGGGGIVNTAAFDIYGLPTITVPCGFSASGLPIGLQISGAHFAETTILALAHAYEQATEWHTKHPKLSA
jgi:aspartyl-tRNA(Asn)/glutamyl-tRNA(Gln) amidotransferase subunit A